MPVTKLVALCLLARSRVKRHQQAWFGDITAIGAFRYADSEFWERRFAVTVRHRNSKGDKLLLSYRHIPLGRKISGGPAEVVKFKPDSAHPSDLHMDVLDSFPTRTADRGRNRYVKGALTDEGRSRRNVLRFRTDTSISARQMALRSRFPIMK